MPAAVFRTTFRRASSRSIAQRGGIELVKAPRENRKYLGRRPSFSRAQFATTCDMLDLSAGISEIAATTGLSRQAIYRIRNDRAGAVAALVNWADNKRSQLLPLSVNHHGSASFNAI